MKKEVLNNIIVRHTGQTPEKINKDTERDFFMSGYDAKEYGIVDDVIVNADKEGVSI